MKIKKQHKIKHKFNILATSENNNPPFAFSIY